MSTRRLSGCNRTGNSQTTDDRSEHRTQEDGRRKHARSDSPVHGIPYVRNDTGAVSEGCDSEETTYKAGDKQSRHVVRAGLADVEDGVHRESSDKDRPSTNQLTTRTPECGADHKANKEEGSYEVAYFPPDMEFMRNSWHRRGWRRRSERAVRDNVSQYNLITSLPGQVGTYTLSVITVQAMVINHLYRNDQFCGFSGSSGPSQVTTFGSVLGLGRKGSGATEELFFGGGSCVSLPP